MIEFVFFYVSNITTLIKICHCLEKNVDLEISQNNKHGKKVPRIIIFTSLKRITFPILIYFRTIKNNTDILNDRVTENIP